MSTFAFLEGTSTLTWLLVGVGVYWLVVAMLRARGVLPSSVGVRGPILTVHTKRGRRLLERLAAPKRFWRAWSNVGLGIALVVAAGTFLLLVVQAVLIVRNPPAPTPANRPENVLVIPGVNEFLPLSVAPEIVLGLLLGLVVHEGGHGLLCRVEDIEIESMGIVLLALLPIGAFVEPDVESRLVADRGGQSRMFAAGVTNNFALTAVAFALLFGPIAGSIAVAPGAAVGGVFDGSAAADAGVGAGDRIVAVGDREVTSNADLRAALSETAERTVPVTLAGGERVTIERSLLVTGVVRGSPLAPPAEVNQSAPSRIAAVNGTPVHTEPGLTAALADRPVATVSVVKARPGGTSAVTNVTAPMGAYVTVQPGSPAASDGVPTGGTVVVTSLDGTRTASGEALRAALDRTSPGETVPVVAYVDGERRTFEVTLGEGDDGTGFLGILLYPGTSGVSVNGFGTKLYPAGAYLELLGSGGNGGVVGGVLRPVFNALVLPFASLVFPGLDYNFAGFVASNAGFYEVKATGPLGALGGWTFLLANVLFWAGWVNLNLGLFNCIPAFPLDGGHLLRLSTEALVSRLPVERGREAVRAVTTSVGLLMLFSLVVMLFGPQLLN